MSAPNFFGGAPKCKKYEEMYYFAKNSKKIVKLMNVRDSNVSVTTNFPSIVLKSLEFSEHRSA